MDTAVVYFSLNGNCEYAANTLRDMIPADVIRLVPAKKYPDRGFKKFLWGGKSAVMAETPELEAYGFDAEKYDDIIIGFPVWAGNIAPPVRTFAVNNAAALGGKRVSAFACQSGSGAEKAFLKLEACLGTRIARRLVLFDPAAKPDPENIVRLKAFAEEIKSGRAQ